MSSAGSRARARARGAPRAAALLLLAAATLALACGEDPQERLAEARRLRESGGAPSAIAILRELAERDPDDLEVAFELGMALSSANETTLALPYLRKAETSPDFGTTAGLELAQIFNEGGNAEETIRALDRVLERDAEDAEALSMRAAARIDLAQYPEVIADAERAIALNPDDLRARRAKGRALARLGRMDDAEREFRASRERAEASGSEQLQAEACISHASFEEKERKDAERAEREFDRCAETYPAQPIVLERALAFYDEHGEPDKAVALARRAVEKDPKLLTARNELATRLAARGEGAAGEEVLREGVLLVDTPIAWTFLGRFLRTQRKPEAALEAFDRAIAKTPKALDALLLSVVDVNAELGRVDAAKAVAARLELPAYRDFAEGRILLAQDDPKGALDALERGLRSWPNNAGARFLAGKAALAIGDEDRALAELVEATRSDPKASDAALLAADLYLRRGDWDPAIQLAGRHGENRSGGRLQAMLVTARAEQAQGNTAEAWELAEKAATEFPKDPSALFYRASLARIVDSPAAAARQLERSGIDLTDPANAQAIRMLAELQNAAGEPSKALALTDAGVAKHPDSAFFHELRGRVLLVTGKTAEARASLERALEIDPDDAPASAALGTLVARGGDAARGLELLDRAAKLQPDEPEHAFQAALLVLSQGQEDDAIARLKAILARAPTHAESCNELAWLLASRKQELPLAQELAVRAVRLAPGPDVLDTLGWVELQGGNAASAVAALEKSLELRPKDPGSRYRLGLALAAAGRKADAERALRTALQGGSFRESDDARARLAELEGGRATP